MLLIPQKGRVLCGFSVESSSLFVPQPPQTGLNLCDLFLYLSEATQSLTCRQRLKGDRRLRVNMWKQPAERTELAPHLAQPKKYFFLAVGFEHLTVDQNLPHPNDRPGRRGPYIVRLGRLSGPLAPGDPKCDYIGLYRLRGSGDGLNPARAKCRQDRG